MTKVYFRDSKTGQIISRAAFLASIQGRYLLPRSPLLSDPQSIADILSWDGVATLEAACHAAYGISDNVFIGNQCAVTASGNLSSLKWAGIPAGDNLNPAQLFASLAYFADERIQKAREYQAARDAQYYEVA